jgi:abortive infection bacteriophage resistance protein
MTFLSNISYYRLSAYMLPFKVRDADGKVVDNFRPGACWDYVCSLYRFDRKLRLLIFDAIERIEIALRTQIIIN